MPPNKTFFNQFVMKVVRLIMKNNCRVPVGLPDVGHYPELFVALLDSGTWEVEDLKKLAGLNFLRVLTEVEQVKINTITST